MSSTYVRLPVTPSHRQKLCGKIRNQETKNNALLELDVPKGGGVVLIARRDIITYYYYQNCIMKHTTTRQTLYFPTRIEAAAWCQQLYYRRRKKRKSHHKDFCFAKLLLLLHKKAVLELNTKMCAKREGRNAANLFVFPVEFLSPLFRENSRGEGNAGEGKRRTFSHKSTDYCGFFCS